MYYNLQGNTSATESWALENYLSTSFSKSFREKKKTCIEVEKLRG